MGSIKVITMDAATPYERGVQYGRQAKEEIEHSVDFYKVRFEKSPGWDQTLTYAREFVKASEEFSKEIVEELQGIADGAGRDIAEIMAVNARYEVSQFDRQECSTGVFFDEVSGKNYIFKNCDLPYDVIPHLVMLHIIRPDGFRALGITEAGQLIRDGYNSRGVAMVNSAMYTDNDHAGVAVPGTVVRKKVWESEDFDAAYSVQKGRFRTVSTNMLIAHKSGKAVDFECYPGGEDEVVPVNGIIATGNRFTVNPERNNKAAHGTSIDRGIRLRALLEDHRRQISAETIMEIMKDHEGYPLSICRHDKGKTGGSVYSVIVNMTDDRIYFCLGNPCEGTYEEYAL